MVACDSPIPTVLAPFRLGVAALEENSVCSLDIANYVN